MMMFGRFFQQEEGGLKFGHLILGAVIIALLGIVLFADGDEAVKVSFPKG